MSSWFIPLYFSCVSILNTIILFFVVYVCYKWNETSSILKQLAEYSLVSIPSCWSNSLFSVVLASSLNILDQFSCGGTLAVPSVLVVSSAALRISHAERGEPCCAPAWERECWPGEHVTFSFTKYYEFPSRWVCSAHPTSSRHRSRPLHPQHPRGVESQVPARLMPVSWYLRASNPRCPTTGVVGMCSCVTGHVVSNLPICVSF